MPITTDPAAAPGLPPSRRRLLAGLAASPLLATSVVAGPALEQAPELEVIPIPPWDGELFRREPEILALAARMEERQADLYAAETRLQAAIEPRPPAFSPRWGAWRERRDQARVATGALAAEAAFTEAARALGDALIELEDVPARTPAGLRLKARWVQHHGELAYSIAADLLAMDKAILATGREA